MCAVDPIHASAVLSLSRVGGDRGATPWIDAAPRTRLDAAFIVIGGRGWFAGSGAIAIEASADGGLSLAELAVIDAATVVDPAADAGAPRRSANLDIGGWPLVRARVKAADTGGADVLVRMLLTQPVV